MSDSTDSSEKFDQTQSLALIKEMIEVSKKNLKNDGILFIVWGWGMWFTYLSSFVESKVFVPYQAAKALKTTRNLLGVIMVGFTLYYILRHRKKVQTYIAISLRYVWIGLVLSLSLTSMIIANVMEQTDLELQHPIFMIFIAFATVITGGIIRFRLIVIGGIVFGILAFVSAYFPLETQLLFESIAWLVAFIIPGHMLHANREK